MMNELNTLGKMHREFVGQTSQDFLRIDDGREAMKDWVRAQDSSIVRNFNREVKRDRHNFEKEVKSARDACSACLPELASLKTDLSGFSESISETVKRDKEFFTENCKAETDRVNAEMVSLEKKNLQHVESLGAEVERRFEKLGKKLTKFVQQGMVEVDRKVLRHTQTALNSVRAELRQEMIDHTDLMQTEMNNTRATIGAEVAAALEETRTDLKREMFELRSFAGNGMDAINNRAKALEDGLSALEMRTHLSMADLEARVRNEQRKGDDETLATSRQDLKTALETLAREQEIRDKEQDEATLVMVKETFDVMCSEMKATVDHLINTQEERDAEQDQEMRETMAKTDARCAAEIEKAQKELREATRKTRSLIISQGEKLEGMVTTLREDTESAMAEASISMKDADEKTRTEVLESAGHEISNAQEKLRMDLRLSEQTTRAQTEIVKSMAENQIQVAETRAREFRVYQDDQRMRDDQQDFETKKRIDAMLGAALDTMEQKIFQIEQNQSSRDEEQDEMTKHMVEQLVESITEDMQRKVSALLVEQVRRDEEQDKWLSKSFLQLDSKTEELFRVLEAKMLGLRESMIKDVTDTRKTLMEQIEDVQENVEHDIETAMRHVDDEIADLEKEVEHHGPRVESRRTSKRFTALSRRSSKGSASRRSSKELPPQAATEGHEHFGGHFDGTVDANALEAALEFAQHQ
jgi:hypothetical protein